MRTALTQVILAPLGVLVAVAADPIVPRTNEVLQYQLERSGGIGSALHATAISKHRGDQLLSLLDGGRSLEERRIPKGVVCALPGPADWWLSATTSNGVTIRLGFDYSGASVHVSNRIWIVNATVRRDVMWTVALLEHDLWREIVATPRPCTYTVGTVRDGGTPSSIARMFYWDTNLWHAIYDSNRTTITNLERIAVGTKLTIPNLK